MCSQRVCCCCESEEGFPVLVKKRVFEFSVSHFRGKSLVTKAKEQWEAELVRYSISSPPCFLPIYQGAIIFYFISRAAYIPLSGSNVKAHFKIDLEWCYFLLKTEILWINMSFLLWYLFNEMVLLKPKIIICNSSFTNIHLTVNC